MVRIKNRFLLLKSKANRDYEKDINKKEITGVIHAGIRQKYGLFGSGCCLKTSAIYENIKKTGIVIVKTRFERVTMVKDVLELIGSSEMPFPYTFDIIHISGTLRGSKREAIRYDVNALRNPNIIETE
ncbi:Ribonuclease P/MRP protein subunit POP5 [Entamoeba marina]